MCSIAGLLGGHSDAEFARNAVGTMNQVMAHRGPDGSGLWQPAGGNVTLGHNRLSIIDLTEAASQPFHSADGRYVLVFNGEIYNHRELRSVCEAKGSVFRSNSDTEVVVEMYRHFGTESFSRLRGMWATVLFCTQENRVVLSRDPFGIKPLYYAFTQGGLAFASEPKALRYGFPDLATVDEVSVRLFIEQGVLDRGDWTFFSGIKRFPQAHFSEIDLAKPQDLKVRRYWSPRIARGLAPDRVHAGRVRDLLRQSVTRHMVSDVTVGACLSGGIDSSSIVCLSSELLREAGLPPMKTFTTEYPEFPEINEAHWARLVNRKSGTVGDFILPDYEQFVSSFDDVLFAQDEPFGTTSIFSQFFVFQGIAKAGVKVVLDGQGADEMFGGYHGLFPQYLEATNARSRWAYLFERALLEYRTGFREKRRSRREPTSLHLAEPDARLDEIHFSPANDDSFEARARYVGRQFASFDDHLAFLVSEGNVPQLLRYEDRDSMFHSIESRVPFLDVDLVNCALSIPFSQKIRRGYSKFPLRRAMKGVLPESVRLRTDKLGFPAPERDWLRRMLGTDPGVNGSLEWRNFIVGRWRDVFSKDRRGNS